MWMICARTLYFFNYSYINLILEEPDLNQKQELDLFIIKQDHQPSASRTKHSFLTLKSVDFTGKVLQLLSIQTLFFHETIYSPDFHFQDVESSLSFLGSCWTFVNTHINLSFVSSQESGNFLFSCKETVLYEGNKQKPLQDICGDSIGVKGF